MTVQALPSQRIAVLGAGHTGPVIARVALEAGQRVSIAASGDPEDPSLVAGQIVVDTMNYWPPADGVQPRFEDRRYGSGEIVQHRLASSRVAKTLNHIGYHELDAERRPAGSPDRRALGIAGDDPPAVAAVAELIERIGYDTVRLGRLVAGRLLEPGGPVFGVPLRRPQFERAVPAEAAYPRRDPLRPEIRHGRPRASGPHDQYRALRHAGHPARPRTPGPGRRRGAVRVTVRVEKAR
ncbi:MAG: NADPH-dependent F420 reductase [Streptosporangiaceae bacterium]